MIAVETLREVYAFWFEETLRKGYNRHRAWSIIGMRIHEMLKHAYHYNVKTPFLEDPEVLSKLKLFWIRNSDSKHRNYNSQCLEAL